MLPIDPSDGQGSVTPAQPVRDILPAQAMTHGGTTIIRPGAIAWGGPRDALDRGFPSCEAVERSLGSVVRDSGQLPGLLAELTRTRLWVPLPLRRRRPFTDGTAIMLPLVSYGGVDFVPCFTSVRRLTTWADAVPAEPGEFSFEAAGRPWRRAGDTRIVPHIVVLAAGLARRLPPSLGLAINPDSAPGVPLYPESVSYLARLAPHDGIHAPRIPDQRTQDQRTQDQRTPDTAAPSSGAHPPIVVGHPPIEPTALLRETCDGLRTLPSVRHASRAWLSVPGQGEGLVISVALDDPASQADRGVVVDVLLSACASVPLRVPFPVDVTFPGEDLPGEPAQDQIDHWIARNTRPFYTRGKGAS
jgi:hypothetical protein